MQGLLSLYPVGAALRPVKNSENFEGFTEICDSFETFELLCFVLAIINCSKCTISDQLFVKKVIKTDATRCLDFSSKCTKMRLTRLGSSQRSLKPPSWIQGVLLLGGRERECSQFCIQIWGERSLCIRWFTY